jgi:hypothetical protein
MLDFLTFPLFIVLLPYYTYAAAHHPLLPRAGTAFTPGKHIEGLLGLTARQLACSRGYGVCENNGSMEAAFSGLKSLIQIYSFQNAVLQTMDAAQILVVLMGPRDRAVAVR